MKKFLGKIFHLRPSRVWHTCRTDMQQKFNWGHMPLEQK